MFDFPKKELDPSQFIVCSNNSFSQFVHVTTILSQFVHVTTILSQYIQSQFGGQNLGGSRLERSISPTREEAFSCAVSISDVEVDEDKRRAGVEASTEADIES